jgi:hypothetical protein
MVVARGGRRPGAGRKPKPVEQHLREGTYRPSRHRRLIAWPLVPPASRRPPASRWRELTGERHWCLSGRQVRLARFGPDLEVFPGGGEEVEALYERWKEWERRYGLAWRLQRECPHLGDAWALASQLGVAELEPARLVAIVDERVAAFDPSLPDPPGWELLERPEPRPEERGLLRLACGGCGAKVILLGPAVAAAVPVRSLPAVREALAGLRDSSDFCFALTDAAGHFPCPACGADQYAAGQERA